MGLKEGDNNNNNNNNNNTHNNTNNNTNNNTHNNTHNNNKNKNSLSRPGDLSVLYAMLYNNDGNAEAYTRSNEIFSKTDGTRLNVKEHVDPSLFVLEPYPADVAGLQVYDGKFLRWVTCDGEGSEVEKEVGEGFGAMILFTGKAFHAAYEKRKKSQDVTINPTLHRVICHDEVRHALIYEQKYVKFFDV